MIIYKKIDMSIKDFINICLMLNVAKNRDEHFLLYSVFMNLGTYNLMNFHNKSRCLKN